MPSRSQINYFPVEIEENIHLNCMLAPGSSDRMLSHTPISLPTSEPTGDEGLPLNRNVFARILSPYVLVDLACIVALIVATVLIHTFGVPFERPIDPTDVSLSHPHLPDIVSMAGLLLVGVGIPLAFISASFACLRPSEAWRTLTGFLFG